MVRLSRHPLWDCAAAEPKPSAAMAIAAIVAARDLIPAAFNTSSGLSRSGITSSALSVQRKTLALAATLHDPRYKVLIRALVDARKAAGLSQQELADRVGKPQSYIGKIETNERRLDALELFDLLEALSTSAGRFSGGIAPKLARSGRGKRGG